MEKEVIPARHAISIMTMFLFGSSVVFGASSANGQDSWIPLLMALVVIIPLVIIYARIKKLFPGQDLFDIAEEVFGKICGKIITALYILYALYLGGAVYKNFSEFFQISALPETPQIILLLAMSITVICLARSGLAALGKWSVVIFMIITATVITLVIFSYGHMNFDYLFPIMSQDFGSLVESAASVYSFPFAETVLFLCIISTIKTNESPYKIYLYSVLFGAIFLLSIILRNTLILGPAMMGAAGFPSYEAVRVINIGDILSRVESLVSTNFIFAGLTKITVCLLAAGNGFVKLFGLEKRNNIIVPIGLLMAVLATVVYRNAIDMFNSIKNYWILAFPFQLIFPLLIWLLAEIKTRKKKKQVKENIYRHYKRLGSNE